MKHTSAVLAILSLASVAGAQTTLLSDDFASVAVVGASNAQQTLNTGAASYGTLSQNGIYNASTNGAMSFASTNNALGYVNFSSTTLSQIGDYIEIKFDLTFPTALPVTTQFAPFRFGIYNFSGNINTALGYNATTNPVGDSARGYYSYTNPAVGSGFNGNQFFNEDLGNQATALGSNSVNGGSGTFDLGNSARTTAYSVGVTQSVTLRVTLTSATSTSIAATFSGTTVTRNDTSGIVSTFDAFTFANGTNDTAWTMDNLLITTNVSAVPEPASFAALGGLVALGFVASRRRRA